MQWHCDQVAVDVWSPSGDSVTFSAGAAGTYRIYATCDGVTSNTLDIAVTAPPADTGSPEGEAGNPENEG